ncbi:DNA repair protein RadC [Microbulbifer sp. ZKSA006]|uniref:RadC family protein n=1 Tax=Microbulbifer sp. ZKSA006 TaxID=3243390 RepID=UPI004039EA2B
MFSPNEQKVIDSAKKILFSKLRQPGNALTSVPAVTDYLKLHLAALEREVFAVIYLDSQLRAIAYREEFQGTLAAANVYPREIVKRALTFNAGAVILTHNHPSGLAEPSQADITITETLTQALGLIGVQVLDHFVIGGESHVSFAQRGLI